MIAKVDLINDEDNDVCIKKFNELKNDWKKSGSAGRKIDNKLWDKFNKSADRFFTAKKEVIDEEIKTANDLLKKLKKNEISVVDVENNIKELTNISKSKELNALRNEIKAQNNALKLEKKKNKLDGYKALFDAYANKKLEDEILPGQIVSKIKDLNVKKSDSEQITYSCIKLEIMAGIESLKKDAETRNKIQLEMLTEKFNASGLSLNTLDSLLIHFFSHLSSKPTTAEKTLWKRISASIENLI